MKSTHVNILEEKILEAISDCRTRVMDIANVELGHSPRWQLLRKQVLKCFGDRGVEGRVRELFRLHGSDKQGGHCA